MDWALSTERCASCLAPIPAYGDRWCADADACAARRRSLFERHDELATAHGVRLRAMRERFLSEGDQPEGFRRLVLGESTTERRGCISVLPVEDDQFVMLSCVLPVCSMFPGAKPISSLRGHRAVVESAEPPRTAVLPLDELHREEERFQAMRVQEERDTRAWHDWEKAHGRGTCIAARTDPIGRARRAAYDYWNNRPKQGGVTRLVQAWWRLNELEYAARRAQLGRSIWFTYRDDAPRERETYNVHIACWGAMGWRMPWSAALEAEVRELGRSFDQLDAMLS